MTNVLEVSSWTKLQELGEGVEHHSFSAFNTFADVCPLKYRFSYLDRLPKERISSALVFGGGVNDSLLSIDQDLAKGKSPDLGAAFAILRSRLETAYGNPDLPVVSNKDQESLEDLYVMGERMIRYYADNLLPDEVPDVKVARRFKVPLIDVNGEALPRPLVGELDRVIRLKDGQIAIVDWKTSASRWSKEKVRKDDQATAYLLAWEFIHGDKPAFFRYDLLLKTVKPAIKRYRVQRSEQQKRRFIEKVKLLDRAIKSGIFMPSDLSFACPTCEFRNACSKWQD